MTNEELAVRIRAGEREHEEELWEQVSKLLYMLVDRCIVHMGDQSTVAGVEREDLKQEAYLAMLDAVAAYDPARGYAFNTYLTLQCQNRFAKLYGQRSKKRDSLNFCISLDEPLGEDGDDDRTLADVIPDDGNMETDVIESMWQERLRVDLAAALSKLQPIDRECIQRFFLDGKKQAVIARELGLKYEKVSYRINAGLNILRSRAPGFPLRQYHEDIMSHCARKNKISS